MGHFMNPFAIRVMIDGVTSCIDWKSRTNTSRPEAGVAPKAPSQPEAEPREQRLGFTTVNGRPSFARDRRFRLRVSAASFLAALVLLLVATPFVQGFSKGPLYE